MRQVCNFTSLKGISVKYMRLHDEIMQKLCELLSFPFPSSVQPNHRFFTSPAMRPKATNQELLSCGGTLGKWGRGLRAGGSGGERLGPGDGGD